MLRQSSSNLTPSNRVVLLSRRELTCETENLLLQPPFSEPRANFSTCRATLILHKQKIIKMLIKMLMTPFSFGVFFLEIKLIDLQTCLIPPGVLLARVSVCHSIINFWLRHWISPSGQQVTRQSYRSCQHILQWKHFSSLIQSKGSLFE